MKYLAPILALSLITAAQAQEQCAAVAAKIPSCAIECIDKAASNAGCNDPTDFACPCKNAEAINNGAFNCVLSGCGPQTGLAVQASASAVCACVASAGPSSAPTSSEAASSPAETSAVPTGHGPEASAGSSAVISSSTAPSVTAAPPYPTQISDGQVQASTVSASSATGATGSNSTVPYIGAGVRTIASVGGMLAAFAAAVVIAL